MYILVQICQMESTDEGDPTLGNIKIHGYQHLKN